MFLFMDSFDHYATADITKKWTSTGGSSVSIVAGAGRRGSPGVQTQGLLTKAFADNTNAVIIGVAFKTTTFTPATFGEGQIISIADSNGQVHLVLCVNNSGFLQVARGAGRDTILATATTSQLPLNTFVHIEFKARISDTVGTTDVRVNGVVIPELSLTGQDTREAGLASWSQIVLGGSWGGALGGYLYWDDVYICDSSGGSYDDFLGDLRMDSHYVTADGNSAMSTPSGSPPGNRWDNVNDPTPATAPDDYNTLAAANDKDTFVTQNLAAPNSEIKAVQVLILAKKTDSGGATLAPVIRQSTNEHVGTTAGVNLTYNYLREVFVQNPIAGGPSTPGPWTETDFNAAEFGYKRIA